ncbi:MAG: hypothetical protein PHU25_08000 [Deltaproteobacteria bacterium]|nr:hypothetical protein [Deltaproteobacteria bacterium]
MGDRIGMIAFNITTTLLILVYSFANGLFIDKIDKTSYLEDIMSILKCSEYVMIVAVVDCIIVFPVGAVVVMMIWNRLIVTIWEKRKISYAESYAIYCAIAFLKTAIMPL